VSTKASEETTYAKNVIEARMLLYEEAQRTHDDTSLKYFRKQLAADVREQKEGATEVAKALRKRALEEYHADQKRAKVIAEEKRLESMDADEQKTIRLRAEEGVLEAKRKVLEQKIANKYVDIARKEEADRAKVYDRWLQTMYPTLLADRCMSVFGAMSPSAKKNYELTVKKMLETKVFARPIWIHNLWKTNEKLTTQWKSTKPYAGGGVLRSIRCGLLFEEIIKREAHTSLGERNPNEMLWTLLEKSVPLARRIFSEATSWTPMKLLHMNDYVIEKTYVYAIVAMSKWVGSERFPYGVYGNWPPAAPEDLVLVTVPHSFSSGSSGAALSPA